MKIGKLDLGAKQILAPMAEITDAPFRKIAQSHGAGLTFTQMVSAKGVLDNSFATLQNLAFHKSEKPIGVQILGNDPDYIGAAASEISRMNPDIIDLNCGCPGESVVKHKMGACLLEDPATVGSLVNRMHRNSNGIPVTVKLRLGYKSSNINILDNAKAAEDNGASAIFVHGRLKSDRYDTVAQWNWIGKVKHHVQIPVIGNGSVFEPRDVFAMKEETGCDAVLIARGALGNPFIFDRVLKIAETGEDPGLPGIRDVHEIVLNHLSLFTAEYGEISAPVRFRKFLIWYFMRYPGIETFVDVIHQKRTIEELKNYLEEHTDRVESGGYPDSRPDEFFDVFKLKVLFWLQENKDLFDNVTL